MMFGRRNEFRNPKIYSITPEREKEPFSSSRLFNLIPYFLLAAVIIWFFFFSPVFQVKKIEIDGNLNPDVKSEIDKLYGKNILTFTSGGLEKELAQRQTSIGSLEIRRGLPNILKVKVNVRAPEIAWKSNNTIYYLNENGVAFELNQPDIKASDGSPLPVVEDTQNVKVTPGSQIVTSEFIDFIQNFVIKSKKDLNIQITAIRVGETTFQIEADTDQNFKIIASTIGNLDNQLKALAKLLETNRADIHEYADLRVEGKVYYK